MGNPISATASGTSSTCSRNFRPESAWLLRKSIDWRAADACHRPRARGESAPANGGRTVAWALSEVLTAVAEKLVEVNSAGTAILLVEQNVSIALQLCHRAYVFEAGRIVLNRAKADLLNAPDFRRVFLVGRTFSSAPSCVVTRPSEETSIGHGQGKTIWHTLRGGRCRGASAITMATFDCVAISSDRCACPGAVATSGRRLSVLRVLVLLILLQRHPIGLRRCVISQA